MKWLFLLLLAADIGLAVWGWEREQQAARRVLVPEPELGDLRLLSEVAGETAVAEEAAAPAPAGAPAASDPVAAGGGAEAEAASAADEGSVVAAAPAGEPEAPPAPVVQPPVLAARPEAEPAAPPEPPVPEAAPVIENACGVIGPIETEEQLQRIMSGLVEQQVTASQRTESTLETVGFWVIIAPYESQREAIDAVQTLRQQGVTDLRRFYRGELKNGISLGMYRRERNAETRRQQILDKGFPAELLARRKRVTRYFIDYRGPAPVVAEMQRRLGTEYPDIPVHPGTCPHIATPRGIF